MERPLPHKLQANVHGSRRLQTVLTATHKLIKAFSGESLSLQYHKHNLLDNMSGMKATLSRRLLLQPHPLFIWPLGHPEAGARVTGPLTHAWPLNPSMIRGANPRRCHHKVSPGAPAAPSQEGQGITENRQPRSQVSAHPGQPHRAGRRIHSRIIYFSKILFISS